MYRKRYLFSAILIMILCASVYAQTFNIVQPRNVIEGRNFNITFRLTDGDANPPAAPELAGCTLLYGPSTSTMQSTQIINGKMSSTYSIDFSYTYRADKAGDVEVPAISVSSNGKTITSQVAHFKILPGDNPTGSQQQGSSQGQVAQAGNVSADDLLVRVSFSKTSVYEQEPVIATIKVYTKYDISSFLPTTQPAFEGFLMEELPVTLETTMEHYNGQNYHTAVLKKLLLYPQRSGKLSVNSGSYDVTIVQYETVSMGFFRTQRPVERQITTSSNAATIQVKALPEPKPATFNGAVGSFSVTTELEPELLRTNEAAVYSYIIKGRGNIKYLNEPSVQFPAGIDVYTPKTDINTNIIGGGVNMSGEYRTDFTFVPQEVGNFTIDGTPFTYFNPESGEYETINVENTDIKVLKGNSVAAAVQQTGIETSIDDILHIKSIEPSKQSHSIRYHIYNGWYWFAYIIVALALVTIIIVYRRHIRLEADVTGRKHAKANRVAVKRLKESRDFMAKHENDKFYASLARALWGYLSDKLSISASQLTRDNVSSKLEEYGLNDEKTQSILKVLDECEMARFTPVHSDDEVSEIYKQACDTINSIENVKKH